MGSPPNLPYTDPWVVLGLHRGASKDEVKRAFRRAALICHPDVDPSPSAASRFAQVKAAADVLLKGSQPGAAGSHGAWDAAAAAAAAAQRSNSQAVPRNGTAALWVGAAVACGLAFAYGAFWQRYVQQRRAWGTPEEAEERLRNPSPQRRKLLAVLLADQQQRQHRLQQQSAKAAAVDGSSGGGSSGG